MRLRYEIVPNARVSAGKSGQVQNVRDVHRVIPGSVVRGALGSAWWSSPAGRYAGPDPQPDFVELFARRLEVGQAVPEMAASDKSAQLVPLSWVRCKYRCHPQRAVAWHDLAVERRARLASVTRCPECQGALDYGRGWVVPEEWSVSTTRTELEKGVAKTDLLYTRRAMRATLHFAGELVVRDGPEIRPQLDWLTTERVLRIGGQLSTMGACHWSCDILPDAREAESPSDATSSAWESDMVMLLRSPAVLIDRFGAPSLDLEGAVRDCVQSAGGLVTVERSWTRPVVVSGWYGIAGVAKPEEWAVAAGSVVRLSGLDQLGYSALARGIGLRRLEGYGQVVMKSTSELPTFDKALTGTRNLAEEQPTAGEPQSASSVSPVWLVLNDIHDHRQREATRKAWLTQARHVQRSSTNGMPPSLLRINIATVRNMAWMTTLSGSLQDRVLALLEDFERLSAHIIDLDRGSDE